MEEYELVLRLLAAVFCGGLIGIEREVRQKSAGVRTHVVVALASALMIIVSKYGFYDVLATEGISVDASRIAAGVVSAIGFLGAGVIFVRRDTAMGLTTAAGLWATVGVGIAIGAGMYMIAFAATVLMIIVQLMLHSRKLRLLSRLTGTLTVDLTACSKSVKDIRAELAEHRVYFRGYSLHKRDDGHILFSAYMIIASRHGHGEAITYLENAPYITELEIHS